MAHKLTPFTFNQVRWHGVRIVCSNELTAQLDKIKRDAFPVELLRIDDDVPEYGARIVCSNELISKSSDTARAQYGECLDCRETWLDASLTCCPFCFSHDSEVHERDADVCPSCARYHGNDARLHAMYDAPMTCCVCGIDLDPNDPGPFNRA